MNKLRPLSPALACTAGCLCLAVLPFAAQAQPSTDTTVRPTVKPVVDLAAAAPVPTETASTPAPDNDSEEKSPPTDAPAADKNTVETDITAELGASFNSKDHVAIFNGNVKVVDPRFQLVCDRLTVFLSKPVPAGQTPPPTPAPADGKKGGAAPAGGSGIDHVVAEGHVVILQKKAPTKPGEEEKISVGRGEKGTFDNKSGDMILTGWPSLEQNGSSLISLAQGTVMTIHRDSSLDTKGPSKTTLVQKKGSNNQSIFNMPTAPAAPASPRRASRR